MSDADAAERPQPEQGADDPARLKAVVEALLFSTDRPVSARRLADAAGAEDGHQVRRIVKELQRQYDEGGHAFALEEIAGGFQLLTRPEFAPWIGRLNSQQRQETLSKAALETLAIVAYRQPITRAEVDDIRGVQCAGILRSLAGRRLAKVLGRSQELGRPLLYGTTRHFLEVFGLRSLKDLPKRADFGKLPGPKPPEQPPAEPEAHAEADAEPQPDAEPEPEAQPEPEPEANAEANAEAEAEAESAPPDPGDTAA